MAEHPSFTLAGLLSAGGAYGFYRTRSKPSLIAGLALGATFAYAGYRLKKNQDYGAEIALGGSLTLLGAGCARVYKTQGKANLPLSLAVVGGLATFYYQRKVREFRYGV